MDGSSVHSHTQGLAERYDVVGNAIDTLVTIGRYFVHIVAQYLLPNHRLYLRLY